MSAMRYQFASLSDVGRVRQNNEDAVLVDPDLRLAVLADGMGGYLAGEVASQMAVVLISQALRQWHDPMAEAPSLRAWSRAIEAAVDDANHAIFERAYTDSTCAGMGTTVVVAAVTDDARLVVAHAGDSRAYRWRAGVLTQLTTDHSLLQEQLDAGLLTPEQARNASYRNFITRALGVEDALAVDMSAHDIQDGDCYLLCSDGLHDMLEEARMAELLALIEPSQVSLDAAATEMVDLANAHGGRDNISVVLLRAWAS